MKISMLKFLMVMTVFALAALACSLPGIANGQDPVPSQLPQQNQVTEQVQPAAATPAATQVLTRPTRQQGQAALPKPTLPAPPAQTTREPASVVVNQPTAQQPDQQTDPLQTEPSGAAGEFYVVNESSQTICYYFMAFSSETEWGEDLLGEQGVINPGDVFTITDVPEGTFDASALDCDGNVLGEVYGFDYPLNDTFTLSD